MNRDSLLEMTPAGLYCPAGDFYIDPARRVNRAVVTHAHSDHARPGMGCYLTTPDGVHVLRRRMHAAAKIETLPYGRSLSINGVKVSLHPAGHVLGSAQVRIEHRGEVWVVTGDYKTDADASCRPFELVRCHTFITEATFALPIYQWQPQQQTFDQINCWWQANAERGITSVLYAYSLGKAQRLIAGVDHSLGPILTHPAVEAVNDDYRQTGIPLPTTSLALAADKRTITRALVVAPPSVQNTPWMRRFPNVSHAFASGWMCVRKTRRQRSFDRGFVLSDHVDWPQLLDTIAATEADRVYPMHGDTAPLIRWLTEHGLQAAPIDALRGETPNVSTTDANNDAAGDDDDHAVKEAP